MSKKSDVEAEEIEKGETRQTISSPYLLYSDENFKEILEKYEKERLRILEEEIKQNLKRFPPILPNQSISEYINHHRDLINQSSKEIFTKIRAVNKNEHDELQKGNTYRAINFNRNDKNPQPLEIKNRNGKTLHKLEYKTDGQLIIADVPQSIPAGPMHLSLALQNESGENIEADKAAYFNISYGSDGKIKSMNYPEPLEFEGDRCKFTMDGQPYYFKVNKTTFDKLNAELAKNHTKIQNLAQDIGGEESKKEKADTQPNIPKIVETIAQVEQTPIPLENSIEFQSVSYLKKHVTAEPTKPARQATMIPLVEEIIFLQDDAPKQAIAHSGRLSHAQHIAQKAVIQPAPVIHQAILTSMEVLPETKTAPLMQKPNSHPSLQSNIKTKQQNPPGDSSSELSRAQQAMHDAVQKRVEGNKYDLPQNPVNIFDSQNRNNLSTNSKPALQPLPKQNTQDLHSELVNTQKGISTSVSSNNLTPFEEKIEITLNPIQEKEEANLAFSENQKRYIKSAFAKMPIQEVEDVKLPPVQRDKQKLSKDKPSQSSQNHQSELAQKQQKMRARIDENNKSGQYNKFEKKQLSNPASYSSNLSGTVSRQGVLIKIETDPEMPSLHDSAKAVAEGLKQVFKSTTETIGAVKSNAEFKSKKGADGKWITEQQSKVVIGNPVKGQHDATKSSGDLEHKQFTKPQDTHNHLLQKKSSEQHNIVRRVMNSSVVVESIPGSVAPSSGGGHNDKNSQSRN